jgi:hypothetical protein
MIKHLLIFFVQVLLIFSTASAQDLHVYYDVYQDLVWYSKGGLRIETPGVRKRDLVQLHVIEFNNYLYNVKTEQKEVNEESGKIDIVDTFFPESSGGINGFFKDLSLGKINAGFSGMGKLDLLSLTSGKKNEGARGDLDMLVKLAGEYVEKLATLTEEMQILSEQINDLSKRISAGSLSVSYIDNLLKSPDLAPTQIKHLVMEHLELMFGSDFVEQPTLKGALSWVENVQAIREKSARLNQLKEKWDIEKPDFDKTVRRLSQLNLNLNEEERRILTDLQNKRDETNLKEIQISSFTDSLIRVEEIAASITTDKLGALYRKTIEVNNHKFEHNETFKPIGREMDIVLNFTTKADKKGGNTDSEIYRAKTIRILNYEGFKYANAPGLCIAGFFTPQKSYSIALNSDDETVISETTADKFIPLVTTALQVYNDRGKHITPGALFGLAVPLIANGEHSQSLNFVMGPSLVIGKDQHISISLGLMGGKTTRLSEGVKPFQPFDTQNGVRPIPTIERYDFGVTRNL